MNRLLTTPPLRHPGSRRAHSTMGRLLPLALCTLLCLLGSCRRGVEYSEFRPVQGEVWNAADTLVYPFDITDSTARYDVLIHLRHLPNYPYQNMWLFVSTTSPDSTVVQDTIEFYLADQRGRWLGSGVGSLKHMPVLYQQAGTFRAGHYAYSICHAMRDSLLPGISDVGVEVIKLP